MHEESVDFLSHISKSIKTNFTAGKLVLDVGSGDINGTNRYLFDNSCEYHGNDVVPGKNVDLVYATVDLPFDGPTFDTIVSSECFQNDPEYEQSVYKLCQILRPGGVLAFTCATTGRLENGTRRYNPSMSFAAKAGLTSFRDYYNNLTFEDIKAFIPLETVFSQYAVYVNKLSYDLLFYGVKKDPRRPTYTVPVPDYKAPGVDCIVVYPAPPALPAPEPSPPAPPAPVPEPKSKPSIETVTFDQLSEEEKRSIEPYLRSIGRL
jgi:SAM-dependent methyltransferase